MAVNPEINAILIGVKDMAAQFAKAVHNERFPDSYRTG